MISKTIIRFVFTISVFVFWSARSTNSDNIFSKFSDYVDLCRNNEISLNFSNTKISDIGPDFISSPLIVCLNLTNNHIERIAKNAFRKLPNLTNLFLFNNKILDLPNQLFNFGSHEKLKVFIINNATDGKFGSTTKIYGNYPNLEILIARNNSLYDLQKASLNNWFPKLKILDLSENKLQYTNFVNVLSNSLLYLNLRHNVISALYLKEKGENLIVLNIDNNLLSSVRYSYSYNSLTLERLKNLRYLSIAGNRVQDITPDAFRHISNLTYLNLSTNYINQVYTDTFANLQSLNTLDLSNNNLKNVPQISKEINISVIYLSCNKIEKISSQAFIQTPKLTKLMLGGNKINQIHVKAFYKLSILQELDLSRNKLSSLPEDWTESIVSLKYLDLSNNAFISLESISLTSAIPLIELYIEMNSLEHLNIKYLENLPQNLTINFMQKSNYTQHCR